MKQLACEMCGSTDIIKQEGIFVCQSCGCKYSAEEAKKMISGEDSVSVKVQDPVKIVNNDFETKLAVAENWAEIYFKQGPEFVQYGELTGFDAMTQYYSLAELAGANESRIYLSEAKFYVEANLKGFADKTRVLYNREAFINHYIYLMDRAINYANESEKDALREQKEKGIADLQKRLAPYKEQQAQAGCYVATAVYGSYDCPEVWTLRRYRDFSLSKTFIGKMFIKVYYAISPTLVRWFGKTKWFNTVFKYELDKMVDNLRKQGFQSTPYDDIKW